MVFFFSDLEEAAKGIILDLGQQGRLLIRDLGNEFRLVANETLAKSFAGQEMMIRVAGEEMRLTVQQFGVEIRSTVYTIPRIAGLAGEQFGSSFARGLKEALWKKDDAGRLIDRMKVAACTAEGLNIERLLEFIEDQRQLTTQQKAQLYEALIDIVNDLSLVQEKKERRNLLLLVGVAILKDDSLSQQGMFAYLARQATYKDALIEKIPGEAQSILRERGERALDIFVVTQPLFQLEAPPGRLHDKLFDS